MQKTLIYVDTNTKSQIYADGEFVSRTQDYLNIERGQWQILCIQFLNRKVDDVGAVSVSPVSFDSNTSFILVADDNFEDEDSLMLKSLQSIIEFDESDPTSNMFNIEGDWIDGGTADYASGQLSVRVNSDTVKYKTVLENTTKKTSGCYLSVKQYMQGISNPSTIVWIPFIALNTIRDWSSAQIIPPSGTESISYINTYFRNPLERQWSSDGEQWFDSQSAEHDDYYRERISNIGAEWSAPIQTVKGDPGEANVLTIGTVTTVESSEFASASITGNSPNQVLNLAIPKGDKGDIGKSNVLTIGTVTTVESSEFASASITGNSPNQVLNLAIPKGDPGKDGQNGNDGANGADGAIITDVLEIPFETTVETGETVVMTSDDLGVSGKCEFDLIDSAGYNISADSRLRRRWTDSGYELTFAGGWPVASWVLKPRGIKGRDGAIIDRNPVMEFTVADSTWGRCVYLDETTPVLTLADHIHSAQSVRFRIESANTGFSGNVVLTPILGGVERDAVVCPTGEWSEISFADLGSAGANGSFSLRRETEDERDTLRDGSTITAIVTVLEVVYAG